jgi:hypothetical protein
MQYVDHCMPINHKLENITGDVPLQLQVTTYCTLANSFIELKARGG